MKQILKENGPTRLGTCTTIRVINEQLLFFLLFFAKLDYAQLNTERLFLCEKLEGSFFRKC